MTARSFWKGETAHIIESMKAKPGLVDAWKASVAEWAEKNRGDPNAAAVNAWLPLWQSRDVYSAAELAPIWPALSIAAGFRKHWPAVPKSAQRLAHELEFYGLPHRVVRGTKYFAVEHRGYWYKAETWEWEKEIENAQH